MSRVDATMIGNYALECQIGQTTIRRINPNDDVVLARSLAEKFQALDVESFPGENASLSENYSAERSAYFIMEREASLVGGVGIAPLANDLGHIADLQRFVLEPMNAKIGHGIRSEALSPGGRRHGLPCLLCGVLSQRS